jgi:hypothetical protein
MRKILIVVSLIGSLFVVSFAQPRPVPRFEDYPAPIYKGKLAPVSLSTRRAKVFRTVLREAAREGVNFAGHYALVSFGCGTACTISAIVDVRNGRVFFPRALDGWNNHIGENWGVSRDEEIFQSRTKSRLLRAAGYPDATGERENKPGTGGIYYYEWSNDRLRLVRFIRKPDLPSIG